jgi:hypothetical protein
MKNIQEWINDKPVLLALTSLEWVYLAPAIYDILRGFGDEAVNRKLKEKFPLPPFNEWINLYENTSVLPSIIRILMSIDDGFSKVASLLRQDRTTNEKNTLTHEIKRQSFSTLEVLKSVEATNSGAQDNTWLQISKIQIDSMKDEISGVDDGMAERVAERLTSPDLIFALRVMTPSVLLYQRNPQDLFREARSGKLDSLAKLLVIDKEILRDETIFGVFKGAADPGKVLEYNMLTKAFRQTPADLVTLKKVKVAVARFILDISRLMGHRLTMNEIRALYDKIEKDRAGDNAAIDEDGLYDSEDSFYKAVIRHPGFDSLFPPFSDKKS